MAIVIDTADGPLTVPESSIQAVARHAEMAADLVAALLEATGISPKGEPVRLPPIFLLELGAALQLTYWEQVGIRLPEHACSAKEAMHDLVAKIKEDPSQFSRGAECQLQRRVLGIWLKHFGWDARPLLQADVVVGEIDEEALVRALAKLLWEHRNDNSLTSAGMGGST